MPTAVLDPCCGDGALLRAAAKRWPSAEMIGFDISARACRATTAANDIAELSTSVVDSLRFDRWRGVRRPDLILCNPPFCGTSAQALGQRRDVAFMERAIASVEPKGRDDC